MYLYHSRTSSVTVWIKLNGLWHNNIQSLSTEVYFTKKFKSNRVPTLPSCYLRKKKVTPNLYWELSRDVTFSFTTCWGILGLSSALKGVTRDTLDDLRQRLGVTVNLLHLIHGTDMVLRDTQWCSAQNIQPTHTKVIISRWCGIWTGGLWGSSWR